MAKGHNVYGLTDILSHANKMEQRDRKVLQLLCNDLHRLLGMVAQVYGATWINQATSVICRRALRRQVNLGFDPPWNEDDVDSKWLENILRENEGESDENNEDTSLD
jgi:hypothetical protein